MSLLCWLSLCVTLSVTSLLFENLVSRHGLRGRTRTILLRQLCVVLVKSLRGGLFLNRFCVRRLRNRCVAFSCRVSGCRPTMPLNTFVITNRGALLFRLGVSFFTGMIKCCVGVVPLVVVVGVLGVVLGWGLARRLTCVVSLVIAGVLTSVETGRLVLSRPWTRLNSCIVTSERLFRLKKSLAVLTLWTFSSLV